MATGNEWQRLAEFTRARRVDLGLTQEEVRAAGGPSTATQRLIEGARQDSYRPVILRRLEDAMGWERGSVRRILDGGEPAPAAPAPAVAAPEPDTLSRIGQAIAAELFSIEDEVWGEIRAARRRGIGEPGIFADPAEAALWAMPVTPEEQRAANIAALRSVRPRPPRRNSGDSAPPVELAG